MSIIYYTLKSSISVKRLFDNNTSISNWFSICDDLETEDPFSGVLIPEFNWNNENEILIKSAYIIDMLNGASILMGKEGNLKLDLIIKEGLRIGEFRQYEKRIGLIKCKVFDEDYDRNKFNAFLKMSRLDLALVYLSNFDHYCRYFLYTLSKDKIDFISLYKLIDSLKDRHKYFIKLYRPSNISKDRYEKWLNKMAYKQSTEPSIIDTFKKFANNYVYIGQISRHGLQFDISAPKRNSTEQKMSNEEIIKFTSKTVFKV